MQPMQPVMMGTETSELWGCWFVKSFEGVDVMDHQKTLETMVSC